VGVRVWISLTLRRRRLSDQRVLAKQDLSTLLTAMRFRCQPSI
jgi:hypothetical protein